MSPFVARCLLVGTSIALVVAGVTAPVSGASRVVVMVAAVSCAVLDLLLVRSGRATTPPTEVVVVGPPSAVASPVPAAATRGELTLGTGQDGQVVALVVVGRRTHLVVVGVGVLAQAVFRALVVQVHAAARADGLLVRTAAAPDLRDLVAAADGTADGVDDLDDLDDPPHRASGTRTSVWAPHPPTTASVPGRAVRPTLPDDTAAVAVDPSGPSPVTLVLVPGLGQLPRRWDAAVEVTRYGCTLRRPDAHRGTPIAPVLPQLRPVGSPVPW